MPRKVRIDNPGYYHIINRGVERRKVFLSKDDKDMFLNILCKEFKFKLKGSGLEFLNFIER